MRQSKVRPHPVKLHSRAERVALRKAKKQGPSAQRRRERRSILQPKVQS